MEALSLADIIDPVAPAAAPLPSYGLYAGIGILLLAGAWIAWKGFTKWHRERNLRRLYREYLDRQRDAHDTLFLMAGELRKSLGLHEINPGIPPASLRDRERENWRNFAAHLSQLRYQPGSLLDEAEIRALFHAALFWMARCRC